MPDPIHPENEPAVSAAEENPASPVPEEESVISGEKTVSAVPEEEKVQNSGRRRKSGRGERKDFSEMTEEEIQAPIREFKSRTLPAIVAVLGCLAAVAYMLWMFGVFGH